MNWWDWLGFQERKKLFPTLGRAKLDRDLTTGVRDVERGTARPYVDGAWARQLREIKQLKVVPSNTKTTKPVPLSRMRQKSGTTYRKTTNSSGGVDVGGAAMMALDSYSAVAIRVAASSAKEDCRNKTSETRGKINGKCCCVMLFDYVIGGDGMSIKFSGKYTARLTSNACKEEKQSWISPGNITRGNVRTYVQEYKCCKTKK